MSVVVNLKGLQALTKRSEQTKRQTEVAQRAALMMRKYVPKDENTLRDSERMNSRYSKGLLIWNTPYAMRQYMVPMNHTEPGTTDHWDEAFAKNDMPDLLRYVDAMYEEAM